MNDKLKINKRPVSTRGVTIPTLDPDLHPFVDSGSGSGFGKKWNRNISNSYLHDLLARGDAAREGELVAAGVRREERPRLALALDHVVDAVRHARLLQDLGGKRRG